MDLSKYDGKHVRVVDTATGDGSPRHLLLRVRIPETAKEEMKDTNGRAQEQIKRLQRELDILQK